MKKLIVRVLVVSTVLGIAATVAASEGPREEKGGTIACWSKGTICHNPADCCHHSCSDDGTSFHHQRCN
jgi:hypothetical protein